MEPRDRGSAPSGLFVARALGRFAAADRPVPAWGARRLLADRLAMAEARGGWRTLARTTVADVADALWSRRAHWLDRCEEGPQGRLHGDAVPSNFLASRGEDVVTVDWQCFGGGPVGSDLGYYALSSREEFDVMLEAFLDGAAITRPADREAVAQAARVTAVYTVLTRAEWALAQACPGRGSARRQVPAPVGGPPPARPAAAVPADRGPARLTARASGQTVASLLAGEEVGHRAGDLPSEQRSRREVGGRTLEDAGVGQHRVLARRSR